MKIKIICKKCGKVFYNWKSTERKFCSLECYRKSLKGKLSYFKGRKRPNISAKLRGKKPSKETREKLRESHKGLKYPNRKRQKLSEQHKKNIKQAMITTAKRGAEHPNWQGGKSFEPYSSDWTETLRRAIRERDNYICQLCSQYGNVVHHIDYNKKNCNPDNLITLCRSCNVKVNSNRKYWIKYFQGK